MPPLRHEYGRTWILDAKAKANKFVSIFASKCKLAPKVVDPPFFGSAHVEYNEFVAFRTRATKRLFKKLNESKATGNDHISAAILKKLADCLAMPFTVICRRLYKEACWPSIWKLHLIIPIFKRGSAFPSGQP